jgi:hypothetical protein
MHKLDVENGYEKVYNYIHVKKMCISLRLIYFIYIVIYMMDISM